MDRRLTPANDRVALDGWQGRVSAERFVPGEPSRLTRPVADLLAAPGGRRERQLVWGEPFTVLERHGGFAFGQSGKDGYVGYIDETALGPVIDATHRVSVLASHAYPEPDMKSHEVMGLSFGARLRVVSASGAFFETAEGYFVPKPHLRPLNVPFADPVVVAQMHFGVPYLWGGNSSWGIDCSGLVQAALLAAGLDCPGDSDLQEAALGRALPTGTPPERGDLFFWKGHVALAVDGETMIHANAHTMSVAYEPIADAIDRIDVQGDGPLTAHKRL
ncbi:MAG: NlpC/P60 family protein [Paracoccaceae bacterium]